MHKQLHTSVVLLSAMALAGCAGSGPEIGQSSLNVVIPNGDGTVDIQTVRYTIDCQGNSDTFLDNNDSFADEVTIQGELEVVDGRTSGGVPTEIWQAFMDLPPGPCIVQLEAFDDDGERICVAEEPFNVSADTTTKINLVLICDVSFQAPVGMADVDGTFSFVVGNFCPDLFVLNALDSAASSGQTEIQVRGRDGDGTCGNNCDPQTCDNTAVPPTCSPGPDPGQPTITLTTDSGSLDCDQDGTTDGPSCVLTGNQTTTGNVDFVCDANNAATITAVITDGDTDCDESKEITVTCASAFPAGSSSTTWIANTLPVGSNGGPTATGGGGTVFITALNTTLFFQVEITLTVTSDGNDNITTDWDMTVQNFLLPTIGSAAELGALTIGAVVNGATPSFIPSAFTPAVTGQTIGAFTVGDTLSLSSPGQITQGSATLVPTSGPLSVNWDGNFTLELTLGGAPLVTITQGVTTFDLQGDDIDFGDSPCAPDASPPPPAACTDDGSDCTADSCISLGGNAFCINDPLPAGTSCATGTGGPGECDGAGGCNSTGCISDADCIADSNECTEVPVNACDLGTGLCSPEVNVPDGTSCSSGTGTCQTGACTDNCLGVTCNDGNECTLNQCDSAAGGACVHPPAPTGTSCDEGGGPGTGVCDGTGACGPVGSFASGSGSTTWRAHSVPIGSNGGPTATGGGCSVFVTALNTTIFFDVEIGLTATSDGANNITTDWTLALRHFLLPTLVNAAEYGGATLNASVTGSPSVITSTENPAMTGQPLGMFLIGNEATFASPNEILAGTANIATGTSGATVNFDGTFDFLLTLGGAPLVSIDDSLCTFDVQGFGIEFPSVCGGVLCTDNNPCTTDNCDSPGGTPTCVSTPKASGVACDAGGGFAGTCDGAGVCDCVECLADAECDDANECTVDLCDTVPGAPQCMACGSTAVADGIACDSGTGPGSGSCSTGQCINNCSLMNCNDSNPCTIDGACDQTTGMCPAKINVAAGTVCSGGGGVTGACDGAGTCECSTCASDAECDDANDCTAETCAPIPAAPICNACDVQPVANGTSCDAGTGADTGTCTAGTCIDNCDGVDCDDGNDCTVDGVCDSLTGLCPAKTNASAGSACDPGSGNGGQCDAAGTCIDDCPGVSCNDGNDCTDDAACDPMTSLCPGSVNSPAGAACDPGTGGVGECDGSGGCVDTGPPLMAAGTGSTTWIANTTPAGSNGGATSTGDGCSVFVNALNTTIFLQVSITLTVTSDGANNVTTGWDVVATHFLLPTLSAAAEYGGLSLAAVVSGATPALIPSTEVPAATGMIIGAFTIGTDLTLGTPGEITAGSAAVSPTVGLGSSVTFNWDGTFLLDLELGGNPLVVVDESVCTFDSQGNSVDFALN